MLIKLGGVKKKTVYKVYWNDPTSHIDSEIGSMTERWNVGYIVKKKNKDRFHLYQIPIVDYQFFYGGKLYKI